MDKTRLIQGIFIVIMRITITQSLVMIILTSLVSAADLNGQGVLDRKVSIDVNDKKIKAVLFEIEDQASVTFTYRSTAITASKKVTLKLKEVTLGDVLKQLFGSEIEPVVVEEEVVLKPFPPKVVHEGEAAISIFNVTGNVTDAGGAALPGVNILERGTTNGTVSDADGNYTINVTDSNSILVFSFVGYQEQVVPVSDQSKIDVSLSPDIRALEEVVVIGYGSVQKKDLTGSVASVSSESISKINTASLNDALQGLAAGVQVTSPGGRPGEASNIIIRGGSSISASNEPLYVIDGFPQLGGGNLDLNPQNIESIDVLKDASAGAIYGARASNGVVIITTKSGSKNGKLNISYTGRVTSSSIIKKLETIDNVDYARIQQVLAPLEDQPLFSNPENWADSASIDWQNAIYSNAMTQIHDLQLTGGSQNTKYSASLGYLTQEGIAVGSDYSRINSRLRIETDVSKKLTVGTNISYATDERNGPALSGQNSAGSYILRARPYLVGGPYEGAIADYVDPDFEAGQNTTNPAKWLTEHEALRTTLTLRSINYLELKPVRGLTLRASGSMNYYGLKNQDYLPSDVSYGRNYNGIGTVSHAQNTTWLLENTAKYKFNKGVHDMEALLGFSAQSFLEEEFSTQMQNFPIENLGFDNLSFGTDWAYSRSGREKRTLASFFGRVNYGFADKYLLTTTLRYDGSSNFGSSNKWGAFPSLALAWRLSEESFVKDLHVFSDLKFRVSYGITGNNSIGNYGSIGRYTNSNISVNSSQVLGLRPSSMPNSALKWEQNKQVDMGLDMGVFDGRLNITADYYKKQSVDLLLNAPIPSYSGFTSFTSNIGDIEASGYELAIDGVIIDGSLKWTSQFNISFPSTRVLKLSDTDFFLTGSWGNKTSAYIVQEGQPLGSIYGYVFDGVNQNDDEVNNLPQFGGSGAVGGPRYRDISGPDGVPDGVVDSEFDRTVLGNGLPDFFGGLINRFAFKGFDLSFIISFRAGNEILHSNKNFLLQPGYRSGGLKEVMNAWTPENPTNELWAWGKSGIEFNNISSFLVEDGSFVRLNNITLGYELPASIVKVVGIESCRFFISGDKVLTFTNYSGYDPEVSYSSSMLTPGVDLTNYPRQKSLTLGLNITF